MRLLVELANERGTPALVNIHDVGLAQSFADRIIGLAEGKIVFDGTPQQVTAQVLTNIYGEEDWSTTIRKIEGSGESSMNKKTAKRKSALDEEAATG